MKTFSILSYSRIPLRFSHNILISSRIQDTVGSLQDITYGLQDTRRVIQDIVHSLQDIVQVFQDIR
jgi:hypothetical protein